MPPRHPALPQRRRGGLAAARRQPLVGAAAPHGGAGHLAPAALAPAPLTIRLKAGDKVFIAGQTGSGKSVLATHLASRFDRAVVFDPKWGDPSAVLPNAATLHSAREAAAHIRRREGPGRVIYQPDAADNAHIVESWDAICAAVWTLGPVGIAIVVHELPFLANAYTIGPHFKQLITAGRLFGITVILVSQRPRGIPVFARSESVHWVCFKLKSPDDLETMADVMGAPVRDTPLAVPHGYWYLGPDDVLRQGEPIPVNRRPDAAPAPPGAADR